MSTIGLANQNDGPAEEILNKIDPTIRQSFTPEQLTAIGQAIQQNWPQKTKHLLDVHSTFSLIIRRFYLAFSFGRDSRKDSHEMAVERRTKTTPRDVFVSSLIILSFAALLTFVYWIHPS